MGIYHAIFSKHVDKGKGEEMTSNFFDEPSFMTEIGAVDDPAAFLRGKACPECGSQKVYVEGRTMLPFLMEARDMIIAAKLTRLTGVDKTTIGRLKKWGSRRSAKDMEAARVIAEEFSVTVDYLLSLDAENYYLEYFWESPPSRVICWDCHYELPWKRWLRRVSGNK